ncbi:hypothetical protein ACQP00_23905 [Dactylosporangium sp. CS-047395]|uniref:hypothetical protein n=1 Tax=Dactylosporangium sp. CS-047395 TaxID=3239936 RepID=UPI003D902FF6
MSLGLFRGALAGAAGTTALNAASYLDMAVRGRPASNTPQDMVQKLADDTGVPVPGDDETRTNRLQGLGPLFGIGVGMAVGALAGVVHTALAKRGRALPPAVEIALIGGAAMATSDVPLKLFGISDPKTWSAKDWASDVVPHALYGAATYAVLRP